MAQVKSKSLKWLSVFLAVLMVFTMLPGSILKASASDTLSITQTAGTGGYTKDADGNITIAANGSYTISGSSTTAGVSVTSDVTAKVTLSDVVIDVSGTNGKCAFSISSGASVNLTLSGTNKLISGGGCAGLQVPVGAFAILTGTGSDSLTATGRDGGAGIGGGAHTDNGSVTVKGGAIVADGSGGSGGGSGIGGGYKGTGGLVTISSGNITATGSNGGAGIGGGAYADNGSITISDGVINSAGTGGSGGGAGIGGGYRGAGGTISISGGTVTSGGGSAADIGNGQNNGSACSVDITGGSVNAKNSNVTNGNGNTEYCVTTSTSFGANTTVTGSADGGPTSKIQTDTNGNLYFWMTAVGGAAVESGGTWYSAHVSGISGNTTATLATMTALDISKGSIAIGNGTVTQTGQSPAVNANGYVITQTGGGSTTNTVSVTGGTHNIVLNGVNIDVSSVSNKGAFSISNNQSSAFVTLSGTNVLKSGENFAGLEVAQSTFLSITAQNGATLEATGGQYGAGIGGGGNTFDMCGDISIAGGDITAHGGGGVNQYGAGGAGIGGGASQDCGGGIINISGGSVKAYGQNHAAGIGGGENGSGGTINISGGTVEGTSPNEGAGIGGGDNGSGGKITITGGTVTARGNAYSAGIGGGFAGAEGTVKISGGTVTASGGNCYDIGSGENGGSAGQTTITGGTVIANRVSQPTNGSDSIFMTTIALPKGSGVQSLSIKQSGATYGYGWRNIQATSSSYGKLYLWLPANDTTTADVATESGVYSGYHGAVASGSANVLKMDQKLTIGNLRDQYTVPASITPWANGNPSGNPVTFTYSGRGDTGYGASQSAPTAVGTYTLTAQDSGNDAYYDASDQKDFEIVPNTSDMKIAPMSDQPYRGTAVSPDIQVTVGGTTLVEGKDYKAIFSANAQVGTASVTVTGIGTYAGYTSSATFQIAVMLESITVSEKTLAVGQTGALTATGNYSDGSTQDLTSSATWNSSDTATATVDVVGNVSACAVGTTDITAKYDGVTGADTVTVVPTATAVRLNTDNDRNTVIMGVTGKSTLQFRATAIPNTALQNVLWNVSTSLNGYSLANPGSGTITADGLFTGTAPGEVFIGAVATDGSGAKGVKSVTVYSKATGIDFDSLTHSFVLTQGASLHLFANVKPKAAMQDVAWSSNNESIATVDGYGNVAGVSAGQATLTATTQDGSGVVGSVTVTVAAFPSINVTGNITETNRWATAIPLTVHARTYDSSDQITVEYKSDSSSAYGLPQKVESENMSATANGIYRFTVTDGLNQTATEEVAVTQIDSTAPNAPTITDSGNYTSSKWYNTTQTVSTTFTPTAGCAEYLQYSIDSGMTWTDGACATASAEGKTKVSFRVIDALGRAGTEVSVPVNIDTTAPETHTVTIAKNNFTTFLNTITFGLFFKDTQTAAVTAADNGSGVASIQYQLVHSQSEYNENGTWAVYPNGGIGLNPDDKYIVYAKITDNAGNSVIINSDGVVVDKTSPDLELSVTSGWQTDSTYPVGVTAGDALAGLQNVSYATDETAPQSGTVSLTNGVGSITLANEGDYALTVTATDKSGNTISRTEQIQWDKTLPTISVSGNPSSPAQSTTLTVNATAGISGIKSVTVSKGNGQPADITSSYRSGYTVTTNGSYLFTVMNNAGISVSSAPVVVTNIDTAKPAVIINSNGYTGGAWTKNDVALAVSDTTKNLGTTAFEYSTDGLNWSPVNGGNVTDSTEGVTTYYFRAKSASGVQSCTQSITVKIDKTAPTGISINFKQNPFKTVAHFVTFGLFFGNTVDVNFSADDQGGSGVDYYQYQTVAEGGTFDVNGTWQTGALSISPDYKGTIYARAVDKAGNISGTVTKSLVVDKTAPVITANSGNPTLNTLDANASIPVEIKDNGAGVGSVTYQMNGGAVKTVDLTTNDYSDLTKNDSFSISNLPDGIYDVVVNAQDNSGNAAATATVHVVKNAAQTGFGFVPAMLSETYGDAPFTAVAAGGQGGGTVRYAVTSGADVLSVDSATGKTTIQKAGTAVITATKTAGNGYRQATAQLTVNVSKATPTIQTLPTASGIQVIGQLSSSKLTGGSGSVAGKFAWTNPDIVVSASGSYDVTFTPTDTDNYKAVNCKAAVTVSPLLTGGSSNAQLDFTGVMLPSGVTSVSLGSNVQGSGSSAYTVVEKLIWQDKSLGNLSSLTVYDLKLLDQNGNAIEPTGGTVTVQIPIPDGMSGNLHVYWYDPANGTVTDMNAVQGNGYLVFETSHFSYYAIAQLKSSASTGSTVPNPRTGSNDWPLIPFALLGGGSAAGFVVAKRRVKYRVKKR